MFPQQVFVAAGMRARLIRNVSIQNRLVNSTMVVIKRWSNDVIVVCPIGRTREYPICRFQQIFLVYGPSVQVKILQPPMLARYACIVHGSQGCSYRIVCIDMASFFAATHLYVTLSRARSLQGLYILNYRREAFLVDPYYVQLWNWFVATNVLVPKLVQHIPPYPRRTFTSTLIAGIMCVCRWWHTKSHFPQNLDARILKVDMLLILQYMCRFHGGLIVIDNYKETSCHWTLTTSMRTERSSHVRAEDLMAHLSNQTLGCTCWMATTSHMSLVPMSWAQCPLFSYGPCVRLMDYQLVVQWLFSGNAFFESNTRLRVHQNSTRLNRMCLRLRPPLVITPIGMHVIATSALNIGRMRRMIPSSTMSVLQNVRGCPLWQSNASWRFSCPRAPPR